MTILLGLLLACAAVVAYLGRCGLIGATEGDHRIERGEHRRKGR